MIDTRIRFADVDDGVSIVDTRFASRKDREDFMLEIETKVFVHVKDCHGVVYSIPCKSILSVKYVESA